MTVASVDDAGPHVLVDEIPGIGFGWIAPTPRVMQRASHAIAVGGKVWFTDPVYDIAMIERAARLGAPAGVVQQLDRHPRDCARVAAELGVPHLVMPSAAPPSAPFKVIPVVARSVPRWHEIALWFPELRLLSIAEAIGGASYFCVPGEAIGPHPFLRLIAPPRVLSGYPAVHVVCGHGAGVHGPGAGALVDRVIRDSRRTAPKWVLGLAGIGGR
jgi:hypothetical protein